MSLRAIVLLLVLANVLLFGYARFERATQSEGRRLGEQVRPDSIRILTSQQVAALGPAKVASLADVCVEWGPFSDAERTRALADLEALQLGRLLTQRRIDLDGAWWVNLGPLASRPAADRRAVELRQQGIDDVSVVDGGRGQFVVSLGLFRTEAAARSRAEALAQQNLRNVRVEPRTQPLGQTMLVVR